MTSCQTVHVSGRVACCPRPTSTEDPMIIENYHIPDPRRYPAFAVWLGPFYAIDTYYDYVLMM